MTVGAATTTQTVGPASAELLVYNALFNSQHHQYMGDFFWTEGGNPLSLAFLFDDPTGNVWHTDALPTCVNLSDLSNFSTVELTISAGFGPSSSSIHGVITSVLCATNSCQPWHFDPPTAYDACCGTNVTLTVLSTITNGLCPQVITRTWKATDCCSNSAVCSQTVTVVDTTPPVLTCASNKTVQCGTSWTFDPPTAYDACCGTNVTLTVLSTITNGTGPCSLAITRTWQATDCCTNSVVCSQTVTVVDTTPPVLTCATNKTVECCSSNITLTLCGVVDRVANSTDPLAQLPPWNAVSVGDTWCLTYTFDPAAAAQVIAGDYPTAVSTFTVTAGAAATTQTVGPASADLQVSLSSTLDQYMGLFTWLQGGNRLWLGFRFDDLTGTALNTDALPRCVNLTSFSLADFSLSGAGWTALGGTHGMITNVLCATNSCQPWHFDPPTASDSCSGTNVTIRVLSTVTNGFCPQIVTRTWQATDLCGNSSTCTQTVTVLDTTPPVLTCASNKTVQCGTAWNFDPPAAYDACCGTNVTITVLNTITNGLCPQIITRTWQATDCCTNRAVCSQTVTVVTPNTGCLPLLARPGLVSITVWEGTGFPTSPHTFTASPSNPTLQPIPGGPTPTTFDFSTSAQEYYDVYVSDPDGTPDTNGCCVTVVCNYRGPGVNLGSGANIDAIELDFPGNVHLGASSIGNVQLGGGITDPTLLASDGLATSALGLHDNSDTALGQGLSRITLCFPQDCSSAKTVECGSNWAFDPPPAFNSCCGSNLTVTVLNTITNGTCPRVITRTWEVTDCCTNKTTCSQTVTVVDTTPPTVPCPTNAITVDLDGKCQLHIPRVRTPASDNCTPASQLVYTQNPAVGTVVPGPSSVVLVTVTDLCGNSSECGVTVIGRPPPPVVRGPGVVIVTNCIVPNVTNLVTATGCCPPFTFTQSPVTGTPFGPGLNSITVTVSDACGHTSTLVIAIQVAGAMSFLDQLYNTGVSGSHFLLLDDTVDPHYALLGADVPAGMPSDYYGNAVAVSEFCHPTGTSCAWHNPTCGYEWTPWSLPPTATISPWPASKWIAPDYTNNGCCPYGGYTYTLNFGLPPGLNPATATISGRWAADNEAFMYLNGNATPVSSTFSFSTWTPFTIPAGSGFVAGPNNTLSFIVTNLGGFTGLRVEFTNAFANCYTCAPPSILWVTPGQSLQEFSSATFHVTAGGTPPLSYQWYHNNAQLVNNGHDSGVATPTLHVNTLSFLDAGIYTVIVSNPCGAVTNHVRLNVTWPWWWPWGWWNVPVLSNPLAASAGPDLNLVGTSFGTNYSITAGTTEDFGLANPGGQIVNVMHVAPLPADTSIQVPLIAPPGSNSVNSYTVIMDLYEPDTSSGTPSTLFQSLMTVGNMGTNGNDGVALTLDAQNNLHLTGSAAGVPFDAASAEPLPVDAWNRVALVIDDPQDGAGVNLGLYLNGQPVASLTVPTPVGLPINWSNSPPTLLSVQTNAASLNGEFDVSSIQFHAVALTPEQLAGIGSPDTGPAPANETSVGRQPVLSATVSNGIVNLSWSGSPYMLQETTDLTSDIWVGSVLPFTESPVNGNIVTTAVANPPTEGSKKFYRLSFSP